MLPLVKSLRTSIGKKIIMALTGASLIGFILVHLAGNMLAFKSSEAFNRYGDTLMSMPLIYAAELALAAIFLIHITLGIILFIQNQQATPKKYKVKKRTGRGATIASATMPYTGFVLFILLIYHLLHFKYGPHYLAIHSGNQMRDLYQMMALAFHDPTTVALYIAFVAILGLHISHGFGSLFQSLGLAHPRYTPIIEKVAIVFAIVLAAIFATIPISFWIK